MEEKLKVLIGLTSGFSDRYEPLALLRAFKQNNIHAELLRFDTVTLRFEPNKLELEAPLKYPIQEYNVLLVRELFKLYASSYPIIEALKTHNPELLVIDNNIFKDGYVVNKPKQAIKIIKAGLPYPKSIYTLSLETLKENIASIENYLGYPMLLKHKSAGKGSGIYKISSRNELFELAKQVSGEDRYGLAKYYLQEFLELKADYRILVIGRKIMGAMQRIPKEGDFRANFSLGGTTKPAELTPIMEEITHKVINTLDLDFAGVDLVFTKDNKPYLLEVNKIPGFKGFSETYNLNIAQHFVDFVIQKYKNSKANKPLSDIYQA